MIVVQFSTDHADMTGVRTTEVNGKTTYQIVAHPIRQYKPQSHSSA